jgi:hypothetical protein
LPAADCLGSEVAGHAVERHCQQSEEHLPRQRGCPLRLLSLDDLVLDLGFLGYLPGLLSGLAAAESDVGCTPDS